MRAKPNVMMSSRMDQRPTRLGEAILNHPFAQGMTPHQVRLLSDFALPVSFLAGESIFREGDPANRFYLIQSGKVALESYTHDKGNVLIQLLGAGDVLGWSWLFEPSRWHFNARALKPGDTILIYGTPLRQECEADHELGYELLKRMARTMLERLEAMRKQLLALPHGSLNLLLPIHNLNGMEPRKIL
jgi:CRP/FNR family transcriptional regulator, cyclic AMP receptor protein